MTTTTTTDQSVGCFDLFDGWFQDLIERTSPDLVVAIARGAVRLLQLRGMLESEPRIEIYSHHALPFLTDEELRGRRVLVFDDSIIYGSTMDEVSRYLTGRGAIVIHAAYVADERYFGDAPTEDSQFGWLNPKVRKFLTDGDLRRHHATLVSQAFHTGLDFNLDFPLIKVRLNALDADEIPYLAQLLKSQPSFREFHNVTLPASRYSRVERWTALHDWSPAPEPSATFIYQPNAKTRVTFVPERHEIQIKPIVQYAVKKNLSPSSVCFSDDRIQSMWQSLDFDVIETDAFRDPALLRLLTFFGATLLGHDIVAELEAALQNDAVITAVTFDRDDSLLVLGPRLSQQLNDVWVALRSEEVRLNASDNRVENRSIPCNGLKLRDEIRNCVQRRPEWCPSTSDTAIESLGKLFLIIQEVTDSPEARKRHPGPERLKVGFNLEGFGDLLATEFKVNLPANHLSLGLDHCVDRALAVAKVIHHEDWWMRGFYCGEDTQNQEKPQVRANLVEAVNQTKGKRQSGATSPFEMQKLCVTLSYLCDFFPVEVGPDHFGMTCTVEGEDLIRNVTKGSNPAFVEDTTGRRRLLAPNPEYCPETKVTWDARDEYTFFEAFRNLRTLFSTLQKTDRESILLLSTCGTADRAFQAIAYEVHAWCGTFHGLEPHSPSFGDVIFGARTDLSRSDVVHQDIFKKIYWSVISIEEARKKQRIWSIEYDKHRRSLLGVLDKKPDLRRWWNAVEADKLLQTSVDPEYAAAFQAMNLLIEQAELLTHCVIRTLLDCGAITKAQLESTWQRHNLHSQSDSQLIQYRRNGSVVAAKKYNENCGVAGHYGVELTGRLCEQAAPRISVSERDWFATAFTNALSCFNDLAQSVLKLFPREYTSTGRYRFSVRPYRKVTGDGSKEVYKDDFFVLVIAFANFDPDDGPNQIRDQLIAKASGIHNKAFVLDQSSESSTLIACSRHFGPLRQFAEDCLELVPDFGPDDPRRVIQVLTFGSVIVATTQDNQTQIRDQLKHRCIHAATGIVSKVQQNERFEGRDRIIVITDDAWSRVKQSASRVTYLRALSFRSFDDDDGVLQFEVHAIRLAGQMEMIVGQHGSLNPVPKLGESVELNNCNVNIGSQTMVGDTYNVGQAGAVGPSSVSHGNTLNQIWQEAQTSIALPQLADQLTELVIAMKKEASGPAHERAIAEISSAEAAARKEQGLTAFRHLKNAGKWALEVATKIGVAIAAAAIMRAIGADSK